MFNINQVEIFRNQPEVSMNRSQFEMSVREVNSFVSPLGLEAISYEYTDWQRPNDSDVMVRAVDKMVGDYQVHCESMGKKI